MELSIPLITVSEDFFVLMGWSLLPNALRPFQIYCAPPNLGIRRWIWRLNFAEAYFFQAWGFIMSLKSLTRDPQLKVPPGGLVLRIFTSWKIHRSQLGLNHEPWISRQTHYPETTEANWTHGKEGATWRCFYHVLTYIYSLLIEKDICDHQNILTKFLCV